MQTHSNWIAVQCRAVYYRPAHSRLGEGPKSAPGAAVHRDAAVLAMVRKIFGDWNNHDATRMGAALAFYSAPNLPARSANQDTLKRQPSAGRTPGLAIGSERSETLPRRHQRRCHIRRPPWTSR